MRSSFSFWFQSFNSNRVLWVIVEERADGDVESIICLLYWIWMVWWLILLDWCWWLLCSLQHLHLKIYMHDFYLLPLQLQSVHRSFFSSCSHIQLLYSSLMYKYIIFYFIKTVMKWCCCLCFFLNYFLFNFFEWNEETI